MKTESLRSSSELPSAFMDFDESLGSPVNADSKPLVENETAPLMTPQDMVLPERPAALRAKIRELQFQIEGLESQVETLRVEKQREVDALSSAHREIGSLRQNFLKQIDEFKAASSSKMERLFKSARYWKSKTEALETEKTNLVSRLNELADLRSWVGTQVRDQLKGAARQVIQPKNPPSSHPNDELGIRRYPDPSSGLNLND